MISALKRSRKIYVFIDAANIWEVQKTKGRLFDFIKLKKYIKKYFNASQIEFFYYVAYPKNKTRTYSTQSKHNFFVFLKKGVGFSVIKKPLKQIVLEDGNVKEKGNLDIEMTIDIMRMIEKYDIAVLFTGDSDFQPLVSYLKNMGKKVHVFSSANSASRELRRTANVYIDILDIREDIWGENLKFKLQN